VAYDEVLAARIRAVVAARAPVSERRMFGGLAFLDRGNMCFGIIGDELMVRVGPVAWEDALHRPGVREMDFTGRSARGMVYVATGAIADDAALDGWLERGLRFTADLPSKG
jgi:TfoX/Sxy family transcriptional regulator of competence genes